MRGNLWASPTPVIHALTSADCPVVEGGRPTEGTWASCGSGYPARVDILGTRAKSQPAPARFVHEALTEPNRDPGRQWLSVLDDEIAPQIIESEGHHLVTWSSLWIKRPEARVRFDIESREQGCQLRWTLLDVDDPGPALVGHMRKRLNQIINAELRYSFGQ
jgi:hypothetical protein